MVRSRKNRIQKLLHRRTSNYMTPQPLKSGAAKPNAPVNKPKLVKRVVGWTLPIVGFVFIVVIGLGGWLFIWPKVQEIQALQVAIVAQNAYNDKLVLAKEKLVAFQVAVKKFASTNATSVAKLDRILPPTEDIPGLLTGSEQLAQELALVLQSVETGGGGSEGAAIPGISTVTSKVAFNGKIDYSNYRKILNTLASNIRLMDIDKVSFGGASGGKEGINFDLTAYYTPLTK